MKTKTFAKKLRATVTDLIVDLEDIVYTFPEEMSLGDKEYFEVYVDTIKEAIRDLDVELDLYKNIIEEKDNESGV